MSKLHRILSVTLSVLLLAMTPLNVFAEAVPKSAEPVKQSAVHTPSESTVCDCAVRCTQDHVDESCAVCAGSYEDCANAPKAKVFFTIDPDEWGGTALYLSEGTEYIEANLLAGVSAVDEAGVPVDVMVSDLGGLSLQSPILPEVLFTPYVVAYSAVHPVTKEEFTVTRDVYVTIGIMAMALAPATLPGGTYRIYHDGSDYILEDTVNSANYCTITSSTNISCTGDLTLIVEVDAAVGTISVSGGLTIQGGYTLTSGSATASGDITVGGILMSNGGSYGVYSSGGNVIVSGTLESTGSNYSIFSQGDITIKSGGRLCCTGSSYGLYANGDITVKSNGALTNDGGATGVSAQGNITVESGGNLESEGQRYGVASWGGIAVIGSMTGRATGTDSGTCGIFTDKDISVSGSMTGSGGINEYGVEALNGGISIEEHATLTSLSGNIFAGKKIKVSGILTGPRGLITNQDMVVSETGTVQMTTNGSSVQSLGGNMTIDGVVECVGVVLSNSDMIVNGKVRSEDFVTSLGDLTVNGEAEGAIGAYAYGDITANGILKSDFINTEQNMVVSASGTAICSGGMVKIINDLNVMGELNVTNNIAYGIYVVGGSLLIDGGMVNSSGNELNGVYLESGTLTIINGGTLTANNNGGNTYPNVWVYDDISITEGTLTAGGSEYGVRAGGKISVSGDSILAGEGEGYGVRSVDGNIIVFDGGTLTGTGSGWRGVQTGGDITVTGPGSVIKGSARTRGDSNGRTASVSAGGTISATGGSMVWEDYPNILVVFDDIMPKDPYANGANIADIANYTWPNLTVSSTGLLAQKNLGNTSVTGSRMGGAAGEPVSLDAESTHKITFTGALSTTKYTLTYKSNGGTRADYVETHHMGDDVLASTNSFARAGYGFTGWNTAADGSGNSYAAGGSFEMPSGDLTLYAQWEVNSYAVIYKDHEGNDITNALPSQYDTAKAFAYGTELQIPNGIPYARAGYTFLGWYDAPSGGSKITSVGTSMGDTVLHARWEAAAYAVTYNANGGTGGYVDSGILHRLATGISYEVRSPGSLGISRADYSFIGWNAAADGSGSAYAPGDEISVTNDLTLYAIWEEIAAPVQYRFTVLFWRFTGTGNLTATIDAPHEKFAALYVDGAELDAKCYAVSAGSTVITLNEAYLKTLSNGTYDVKAMFNDGSAETTLTVDVQDPEPDPEPETVPVTGVALNQSALSLNVGGRKTLTATVKPDDATNKNVVWESSEPSIATVSAGGKVKGVKAGTATITIATEDGDFTAACEVTVTEEATRDVLALLQSPATGRDHITGIVPPGSSVSVTVDGQPVEVCTDEYGFFTANTGALSPGQTVAITVTLPDGTTYDYTYTVAAWTKNSVLKAHPVGALLTYTDAGGEVRVQPATPLSDEDFDENGLLEMPLLVDNLYQIGTVTVARGADGAYTVGYALYDAFEGTRVVSTHLKFYGSRPTEAQLAQPGESEALGEAVKAPETGVVWMTFTLILKPEDEESFAEIQKVLNDNVIDHAAANPEDACAALYRAYQASATASAQWRVTADSLNVRKGPGGKYDIGETIALDQVVAGEDLGNGWVKLGEGRYAARRYLEPQ